MGNTAPDLSIYAKKSDISNLKQYLNNDLIVNYQPKGEYATTVALSNYQPKGDYATIDALSNYQPRGDYQPKGSYATIDTLANYQTKGDYVTTEYIKKNTMWCADGSTVCVIPTGKKIPLSSIIIDDKSGKNKQLNELFDATIKRIDDLEKALKLKK